MAAVLALVAASCGSSTPDSAANSDDTVPVTTPTTGAAPVTVAADASGDSSSSTEPTESTAPAELTATDTGVTADSIRIAAVFPDLTAVGRDNGDVPAKFRAAVDRVNDAGGINGRTLEVDVSVINPLDDTASDTECVRHTEDDGVFAAVGLFLRDQVLCYIELHDTAAVSAFAITPDQISRSTAPLFAVPTLNSRAIESDADALIAAGVINPGMKIAVHGVASRQAEQDAWVAALQARGVDVVADTVRTIETDVQAGIDEVANMANRWLSSGAEAILGSNDEVGLDLLGAYDRLGIDLPMILPAGTSRPPILISTVLGVDVSGFSNATSLIRDLEAVDQYKADVNGVKTCVDDFSTRSGETIDLEANLTSSNVANIAAAVIACSVVDIFVAVAREAGPELTTESFGAAANRIGAFKVTGVSTGSLGPDKPDFTDTTPRIAVFDASSNVFVPAD